MALNLPPRIEKIVKLSLPPMRRMLDVGCGNGEYSLVLKKAFGVKELYGVDMARDKGKRAKVRGMDVVYIDLNKSPLPHKDGYFDLVFAGEILEHMLRPDKLLVEMRRVLKPKGYCIITTPNIANWYDRFFLLGGWQPYSITIPYVYRQAGSFWSRSREITIMDSRYVDTSNGYGLAHVQFFTYRAIKALVKMNGFEVIKDFGYPAERLTLNAGRVIRSIIIKFDTFVATLSASLATGLVIVARKRVGDE